MRERKPGDVVGLFVDKLQLAVQPEHVEQNHSYRSVANPDSTDTMAVQIEKEFTRFIFEGRIFVFDGVEFRPNSKFRQDESFDDGKVRLKYINGSFPSFGHRFRPHTGYFSLKEFRGMLLNGEIEPAERP